MEIFEREKELEGICEILIERNEVLEGALEEIRLLDPGLWWTAQKIAERHLPQPL